MTHNYCDYCNRNFKFKDLFDQHTVTCEYFYKKKRDRDRETESFEQLPTQQELYKLVQQLTVQCCKLQKDVDRLNSNSNVNRRKYIIESLNNYSKVTSVSIYDDWIKIKNPIKPYYLERVFQEDLTDGIKTYISDLILLEKATFPIRSFTQKPNVIYGFCANVQEPDKEFKPPSWKILTIEQFGKWIMRISHSLLQAFVTFQTENVEKINSSESEKDKNIIFMIKINGGKISDERRWHDIKKWIIPKIASPDIV